ncbi:MAG: hypothetical protein NXI32_28635, partial [bacterium]|nr:hypothetical protein [bacterium]
IAQHPTRGEIIAATHGRGLWIMDASALRQLSKDSLNAEVTLYRPNKVIRWRSSVERGSSGTRSYVGKNPAGEAAIYYSLGRDARKAKLTISDLLGEELFEQEVSVQAGLHRVDWDLRVESAGPGRGRRSLLGTGEYLVSLRVDGRVYLQPLSIVNDPNYAESTVSAETQLQADFWEAVLGIQEDRQDARSSNQDR